MPASPKPRKWDRLKAVFRTRLDRSVRSAPNSQAVTQSTSQERQPRENRRTNIGHQGTTLNPTFFQDASINTDDDNHRTETPRTSAQDSLWDDALTMLETSSSAEDRSHARALRDFAEMQVVSVTGQNGSAASDGDDLIEKVKRAAEFKRAESEQKAWRIEVGSRTIVLRDVATRIIDCLNKFKEIGDVAVSYDPVHAALPWAAFRFLLQAATLNKEQTGQLLAGIDAATQAYLRARIYQDLYLGLPDHPNVADALKTSVVNLLAAIYVFLGLAVKNFLSGSIANAARGLLSPEKLTQCIGKIAETEDQMEKNALSCKAILDAAAHQRQGSRYGTLVSILDVHTDRFDNLQGSLTKMEAGVGKLIEKLSDEEVQRIFSWISRIPYESDLHNARRGRLEGTCEWLIAHRTYLQWKESSISTTLWLHGIPGAGKTKLSTKVVDDIARIDMPLAYFFCDRNQENRRDPMDILHSITRQLSRLPEPERIKKCSVNAYDRKKEHGFASEKLTSEEARDLLLELVNGHPSSTIVIDGLDECNEKSRRYILDTLDHLVQHSKKIVRVFVASRNDKDLTQHYSRSPNLEIEAANNQDDIEMLVLDRVSSSQWAAEGMSVHVRDAVVRLFRGKSQGMFQWASLHIDELLELESDQAILNWLHSLPEGLKSSYDRIYDGLGTRWRTYADRAFMWLMAAHDEPISPELLCILVCQDVSKDFDYDAKLSTGSLLTACRNLIKFDDLGDNVSVSGSLYVNCGGEDSKEDDLDEDIKNYEQTSTKDELYADIFSRNFDKYSRACRFAHLSVQEYLETYRLDIVEAERMVLEISVKFWRLVSATGDEGEQDDTDWMNKLTWEHTLYYKHTSTYRQLQRLTAQRIRSFLRSADMSTANQHIWDQLLRSTEGYDVVFGSPSWRALDENINTISSHPGLETDQLRAFASPIGMCAWFGNQGPIKYWIESGLFNPTANRDTASELVFATCIHQRTAVCNLLLDAGTNFKDASSDFLEERTRDLLRLMIPFKQESYSTLVRLLEQLFDDGIAPSFSPSHQNVFDGTFPLNIAQMFLQRGADPNVHDHSGQTPLMHAVSCGDSNIKMTRLLLQHGAEVMSVDEDNGTPLHYAAQSPENLETLRLLLDHGADPDARDARSGATVLVKMALHSNLEAMKLLLESNARVDSVFTRYGGRSLAVALRGSRGKEANDLLIAHGADQRVMSYLEANAEMPPWIMVLGKKVYDFDYDPLADSSDDSIHQCL